MRFFLLSGVCIGILLKIFAVDIVRVSGESMAPALKNGSFICINKLAYGIALPLQSVLLIRWAKPHAGEIITYVHDGKTVVKRCAATEGTVLEFSSGFKYGVTVGEKVYPLTERQYQRIKFDTVVPENTVLAIGDNSGFSVDSRDYGFVPIDGILGRAVLR